MMNFNIDDQIKIIAKGTEEIINIEELKAKLIKAKNENRKLVVKLGLDPTAPDIHLGHTVVLRKIKQFQDLGHKAVIIIGDFTGMIGDPTGKSKTRKQLTQEEVLINAETYKKQIFKILDPEKTEVRFNSEWLEKLSFNQVIELMSKYNVSRMLEREDFKKRFLSNESISIHEFMYPLIQGWDSVEINADIEIGATEQRFNILMGRTVQKEFHKEKQVAIFMPILEGLDGKEKMSKSLGNYVGIDEDAFTMFSKIMTIPDECIVKYFELLTDIHPDKIAKIKEKLENNEVNPRNIKLQLAKEITILFHNKEEAEIVQNRFINIFQKGQLPKECECIKLECISQVIDANQLIDIIIRADFAKTKREARRLLQQGAIKINKDRISCEDKIVINNGDILQCGKNKFIKLI